ncbi:cytoplasmic polyadenylation element-binding protein 2-like [Argopecten irradians]|uniref:cytoplasmic polyadenylation element-binding protein 2-like n=1 Tax=Argopecten irradians TaxID=31199 RepID=UPI00371B74FC
MGDYGVAVSANIGGLSSLNNKHILQSKGLFTSDSSPTRTMQDDILLEKSTSKQSQQLQVNTENGTEQNGENFSKNGKIDSNTQLDERRPDLLGNVSTSSMNAGEVTNGTTTAVISMSSAAPAFWSNAATDDSFVQGFPSVNGTVAFQQFPPTANNMFNAALASHMGMNVPPQQQPPPRRAITAHHNFPQRQGMMMNNNSKSYPNWSNAPQPPSWSQQTQSFSTGWANVPQQRRSMPSMNPVLKKPSINNQYHRVGQSTPLISPSKFRRSTSFPGQMHQTALLKPNLDLHSLDDSQRDAVLTYQDRSGSYDSMRFSSFETQLLDIMRSTGDPNEALKGKPTFGFGEGLDEDGLDQSGGSFHGGSQGSPGSQGERIERFSRKVFVGGLPPDIDEEEITAAFRRFGALVVDWPHKAESKSYFPPKGYCFLLFQDEMSVQALIESCIVDDDKLYWCVSSPTMKDKPVQIRPWNLSDSDFVMDGSQPLDPRKTIFVGGVPRPLRAVELAMIMDRLYGGVCYAGIDTDPELKYPKGAGRVAFSNQQSYIAAISARFVQLQHGEIDKRVEVKPYVLDDQMCDECQGARCGGKFAPFFCANVTCLQYYCEHCWAQIHSRPGREFHKPLVKEGADRPRAVPFRWC